MVSTRPAGLVATLFVVFVSCLAIPHVGAAPSDLPPHWDLYMGAGTKKKAQAGDMAGAIRSWTKLYAIAQDSCERGWAAASLRAAREAQEDFYAETDDGGRDISRLSKSRHQAVVEELM